MLSFYKIKYSFVLCLALLFSLSFAGTVVINGDSYNISDLPDTSVNYNNYDDYFFASYIDTDNLRHYDLWFYNDNSSFDCIGAVYWGDSDNNSYDVYYNLTQSSDGYTYYVISSWRCYWDPYENYAFYPSSYEQQNVTSFIYTGYDVNFYHCNKVVYSCTQTNQYFTLGNPIYVPQHGGGGIHIPFPTFSSSLTSQEINDSVAYFLQSSAIPDNLPSNYTHFFVTYDEDTSDYWVTFFPESSIALGIIEQEPYASSVSGDIHTYSVYFTDTLNYPSPEYALSNPSSCYVYVYASHDLNNFRLDQVSDSTYYSNYKWYYEIRPVIYSNFNFTFYSSDNGVVLSPSDFTLTYSNITDSDGNILSISNILNSNKNSNSIWQMIYNLFNPPSSMSQLPGIEQAHQSIIDKADFNLFFDIFNSNHSLLDFTGLTWLITANNAMFNIFAGFLSLCVFFLTVSRIMR